MCIITRTFIVLFEHCFQSFETKVWARAGLYIQRKDLVGKTHFCPLNQYEG